MEWQYIISFIIGGVCGYIACSFLMQKQNPNNAQFEKTQFELEQQKQEMADYFAHTHEMLAEVTTHINRLNTHWNESAKSMLGDSSDKQLVTFTPISSHSDSSEQPPKDYVKGSQRIINQ